MTCPLVARTRGGVSRHDFTHSRSTNDTSSGGSMSSTLEQELAALSYSIAHDLHAPLRTIDGFSEALEEEYAGKLDEQGREYLRLVRNAAARMEQLFAALHRLSDVSRGELRRERVNLSEIARSAAAALRETGSRRNVTIDIEPDLTAEGDPALLRVVFEELFGNAWKFTSRHPAASIRFGSEERDGTRFFYVRDDGAGFDPKYAAKLFGPFQRLHGTNEFEGVGMGLAIVRRIIHRHGGNVWAAGETEQGVSIYFNL